MCTQIFLPLLAPLYKDYSLHLPEISHMLLLYKCFPLSDSPIIVKIVFAERQSILSSVGLGSAGLHDLKHHVNHKSFCASILQVAFSTDNLSHPL